MKDKGKEINRDSTLADNKIDVGQNKNVIKSLSFTTSENHLYTIFKKAPSFIAILRGPDYIFEFVNEKYLQLIGKTDNIIGKPVLEVLPEVEEQGFIDLLDTVRNTGESFIGKEIPAKLDRNDDSNLEEVFMAFIYEPVKDEKGEVYSIFAQGIEVTEKVKNRQLIAESEEKYRSLFERMDQALAIVELIFDDNNVPQDYIHLEVNPQYEKHTGLKDPLGKTALELVPDFERRWIDIYGKVALTGESSRFVEGSEAIGRWFDVYAFRMGGPDSRKVAIFFTDITERKKSEEEFKRIKDQLTITFENTPNGQILFNKKGNILKANQLGTYFRGYRSVDELLSQKSLSKIRDRFLKKFNVLDEEGNPIDPEFSPTSRALNGEKNAQEVLCYIDRSTGEKIWILDHANPIFDSAGNVQMVLLSITNISAQKEAEEIHRKNEEKFKTYTEAMPQMAFIADAEGNITYYNKRWYDYVGNIKKTKGWGWKDKPIHHPDDLQRTIDRWKKSLQTGETYEIEYRLRRHDGQFRWHLGRAEPIRNDMGEIEMWLGTNTDIHERKEAEEEIRSREDALLASEKRFRGLADNISQLAWITDETGWVSWYNKRWFDYTGTSLEEMEGWGWQKLQHPDYVQDVINKLNSAFANGEEWEDTFPLKGKDGKYRWFLSRAIPIKDEKDNILHWFGTNTDITEILEAEEKLNYQKSLLEAQLEVSPLGVLVVSQEGKMITYNKRFMEMWGFASVRKIKNDEVALNLARKKLADPEGFLEKVHYAYQTHEKNYDKLYFKDGKILERYGSPVIGEIGTYYGYVWFFNDITERENLLRQKDEFLGIASHELKTPVTSIKGYTQILQDQFSEAGDEKTFKMLSRMDMQLDKLTMLISDLLDVTRVEQGKLQFHNEPFELNNLVKEISDDIQQTNLKYQIIQELDQEVIIIGDRDRVGQVIINLLTNAIKYSPKKNNIIIRTTADQDKKEVEVAVQDHGLGLSKEDQEKVFDRFFRVGNLGFETFPGLGLGLFISAEIVHRHNGIIGVESKIGKGSIFYFTLPIKSKIPE